jgi:hypothetical protein
MTTKIKGVARWIKRIQIAGMQEYRIEYFVDSKKGSERKEIVLDAPTEEVALDRAIEKLKIEPLLVDFPWNATEQDVEEAEPILHSGWWYYPKQIVNVITPDIVDRTIKAALNGYKIDTDNLTARSIVEYSVY